MKKIFLILTACLSMAACTKNDNPSDPGGEKPGLRFVTVKASMGGGSASTKVISDDITCTSAGYADTVDIKFESTDSIMVLDTNGKSFSYFHVVPDSIKFYPENRMCLATFIGYQPTADSTFFTFYGEEKDTVEYMEDKVRPYCVGWLTMNRWGSWLTLQPCQICYLKLLGDVTLGYIKFTLDVLEMKDSVVMKCGESGIKLSDDTTNVYFPTKLGKEIFAKWRYTESIAEKNVAARFHFYDTEGKLLESKKVKNFLNPRKKEYQNYFGLNQINTMPVVNLYAE